jgi:hypothetical protein
MKCRSDLNSKSLSSAFGSLACIQALFRDTKKGETRAIPAGKALAMLDSKKIDVSASLRLRLTKAKQEPESVDVVMGVV